MDVSVSAGPGWRAEIRPADHPVADLDFDVVVGADGRRNSLEGMNPKSSCHKSKNLFLPSVFG